MESSLNTVVKFDRFSYSGIIEPNSRILIPEKKDDYHAILITNTGKSILHIFRAFSPSDTVPINSIVFHPGEIKKILQKEIGFSKTKQIFIHNPDCYSEGKFAMVYL